MATKKKKVAKKKEEIVMLNNKDLVDILKEEMSPSAKLLKVGMILAGGVNLNIYTVGHRLKMHAGEIHQALSELRHHRSIEPGQQRDTVNIRR
ncbi:MAG: hypothetical protein Unbinned1446contig1004_16 [Prokaryotic dsDNA virus sp.]|nr:MAG: hypothetical protein Unbinned1446contig1004_16 [Prokaryotic dsDNA virus sp.]|tara:strand:+ start:26076 stop:26354 length:279 start_codon:yes stop_codon:yes gene_type:complete